MSASAPPPAPAGEGDVEAVILAAREALAQAVHKGNLTRDPLRFALGAISDALGAFLAGIKATRQPIDPEAQAEMVRQVIAAAAGGANKEAARLARTHNRRTLLLAALTLFGVAGAATGGGYVWGQASGRGQYSDDDRGTGDGISRRAGRRPVMAGTHAQQ